MPKALLPVGGVPLLDLAIGRVRPLVDEVAVNAHYLHEQIADHLAGADIHLSIEQPEALGTAGALGNLRDWIDGRDVLLTNSDAWYSEPPPALAGPDMHLLAVDRGEAADFGNWQYAGTSWLPWSVVERFEPVPGGLYEVCWREAWATNRLDLVPYEGTFIDCGTPADYARANAQAERAGGADGRRAGDGD